MKIIKWLIIGVFGLIVSVMAIALIGSSLSMDRDYTHTKATAQLPFVSAGATSGFVRIKTGEFEYRARVAGLERSPQNAPTVVLLHGFPVTSAMWEPLIVPLAEAGYRVVAFDQRGYSPGARPEQSSAYATPNLMSDVLAIADAVGAEKFHLLGHDWGAGVGWGVVIAEPERIISWTGVSIAHPVAFGAALQNDPDQQSRSGYFALFTAPLLPETLFTFNNLTLLMSAYAPMPETHKQEYRAVFSEPGALTSALNWYRQMGTGLLSTAELDPTIKTPTLFIWGNSDPSAGRAAVDLQADYMKGPYEFIELDGGHWLMETHSAEIVPAVLAHLKRADEI